MNKIQKSESNPNLKYPKNSNRRIFSSSQIKYNKNNNKKLYQSVNKYII